MEGICCLTLTSGISLTQSSEGVYQILLPQAKGSFGPYFQPALALLAFIAQPVHCNKKTAGFNPSRCSLVVKHHSVTFSIACFTFSRGPVTVSSLIQIL